MITALLVCLALGQTQLAPAANSGAEMADTASMNPQARTAEIAIQSATAELERIADRSPLLDRLLVSARAAYAEGRYDDAISIARRVRLVGARRGQETTRATPPAHAFTAVQYEALERLVAEENRGGTDPAVLAARELVDAAEAAMAAGNVSQADNLARRAILMLAALPPSRIVRADTSSLRIDVNRATREEWRAVPGVTEEMIRNLVWFRKWIGPLRSLGDLRYVPGFDAEFLIIGERFLKI